MQHDELLFKFNMDLAGNDAQQEMAGLEARGPRSRQNMPPDAYPRQWLGV